MLWALLCGAVVAVVHAVTGAIPAHLGSYRTGIITILAFALAQMGSIAGRFLWGLISDYVLRGDRMLPIACACVIATVADIFVASHYATPSPPIAALGCKFFID